MDVLEVAEHLGDRLVGDATAGIPVDLAQVVSWIGKLFLLKRNLPRVASNFASASALRSASLSSTLPLICFPRRRQAAPRRRPARRTWSAGGRSFWNSWTNFLLAALSRSAAHCEVLRMPIMGSPTALIVSSSAEKPAYRAWRPYGAGSDVLLDEVDAHAARQEEEHGVGLGGADVGDLRREVELAELDVDFVGDLALVELLETVERLAPARIVGRD